jgi:hypothetical protein
MEDFFSAKETETFSGGAKQLGIFSPMIFWRAKKPKQKTK